MNYSLFLKLISIVICSAAISFTAIKPAHADIARSGKIQFHRNLVPLIEGDWKRSRDEGDHYFSASGWTGCAHFDNHTFYIAGENAAADCTITPNGISFFSPHCKLIVTFGRDADTSLAKRTFNYIFDGDSTVTFRDGSGDHRISGKLSCHWVDGASAIQEEISNEVISIL